MFYTVALDETITLLFLSWGVPTEPVSEYVYFYEKKTVSVETDITI